MVPYLPPQPSVPIMTWYWVNLDQVRALEWCAKGIQGYFVGFIITTDNFWSVDPPASVASYQHFNFQSLILALRIATSMPIGLLLHLLQQLHTVYASPTESLWSSGKLKSFTLIAAYSFCRSASTLWYCVFFLDWGARVLFCASGFFADVTLQHGVLASFLCACLSRVSFLILSVTDLICLIWLTSWR